MKLLSTLLILLIFILAFLLSSCDEANLEDIDDPKDPEEIIDDGIESKFDSYTNLVMAGYQGWFAAEGDDSDRGWYHYKHKCGFEPGCCSIDFWPDMSEYTKKYVTPFKYADGSDAYLFSPYDYETVDLHFKWMKDYGIDGVHMQRFVGEIKPSNEKGKRHFNKVLENALAAAKKYDRAISIMYDLSGSTSEQLVYLEDDWEELQNTFDLFNQEKHPTYLRHNGKPLLSIWGVGFSDDRNYTIADVDAMVDRLKGSENNVSIMLGVPYYWRTLERDTENSPALHELIRKVDIIMPWAVGRYNMGSYKPDNVIEDLKWTVANEVDYVPLVFPGFTWGNLKEDPTLYNHIPRNHGDFLWQQIAGAKGAGALSLYVAMFDEVDEGTAIFKSKNENDVPLNGDGGMKFVGIEEGLETDYYLWLTGQGANWFHGEGAYSEIKPIR